MALDELPDDLVRRLRGQQLLPQVLVLDGLVRGRAPAVALPVAEPALAVRVDDVGRVALHAHACRAASSAFRPSITPCSSMRLFVVCGSPPESSRRCSPVTRIDRPAARARVPRDRAVGHEQHLGLAPRADPISSTSLPFCSPASSRALRVARRPRAGTRSRPAAGCALRRRGARPRGTPSRWPSSSRARRAASRRCGAGAAGGLPPVVAPVSTRRPPRRERVDRASPRCRRRRARRRRRRRGRRSARGPPPATSSLRWLIVATRAALARHARARRRCEAVAIDARAERATASVDGRARRRPTADAPDEHPLARLQARACVISMRQAVANTRRIGGRLGEAPAGSGLGWRLRDGDDARSRRACPSTCSPSTAKRSHSDCCPRRQASAAAAEEARVDHDLGCPARGPSVPGPERRRRRPAPSAPSVCGLGRDGLPRRIQMSMWLSALARMRTSASPRPARAPARRDPRARPRGRPPHGSARRAPGGC